MFCLSFSKQHKNKFILLRKLKNVGIIVAFFVAGNVTFLIFKLKIDNKVTVRLYSLLVRQ